MAPPRELTLRSAVLDVVLLPELGGRIHRIRTYGVDLLRTPADPATHAADPFFWGAYPMAPWCNRASAGPGNLAGRRTDLASNFPDGSAIHGLVYGEPWEVVADGTLAFRHEGYGWPWAFEARLTASVEGAALSVDLALVNRSDAPMPAGLGLHPWFRRPLELRVPARTVYASNVRSEARPMPATAPLDLGTLAAPPNELDGTWADLDADWIDLAWPGDGVAATLEVSADAPVLVAVASPSSIDAVAIEPQTHGPDPLRRLERDEPHAPALLDPGAELRLSLRLTVARMEPAGPRRVWLER